MIKKCIICGKEFDAQQGDKFCSDECRSSKRYTDEFNGQRFGRLLVINAYRKNYKLYAVCKCDCGKEITTLYNTLKCGQSTSCGCLRKERVRAARIADLTGKTNKYGCVAIKCLGSEKNNRIWLCKCPACGNEFKTTAGSFYRRKSCGCIMPEVHAETIKNAMKESQKALYKDTYIYKIASNKLAKNNTSGVTGVSWLTKQARWAVSICFQGKTHYIGVYKNFEDAVAARKNAEDELFKPVIEEFKKKKENGEL